MGLYVDVLGGPSFGGLCDNIVIIYVLMNSKGGLPLWWMNSRGGPPLLDCMLMNSRRGPPFWGCMLMNFRGGPPFGWPCLDEF